ncbi:nucleotidyltransferase domain-containing protein [Lacisediminihabitans sp.]|uniref:nucleotidyltransferase domain-containing protein n=1 Tax=Lacisediminihabitans sp. TaxID=2787631 RepID=UPI00374D5CA7
MRHHEAAIEAYLAHTATVPQNLAVIITGSVARGTERADSDVDLYLVVTDEALEDARRCERLMYTDTEFVDYEGGYLDIKVASERYLDEAAEHGDDPMRASLDGARIVWSRVDGLQDRLARILDVPESVWIEHMASFVSQARLHGEYFLRQGHELHNPFLLQHASVHLASAACRALLAANRVLFPGPKYLEKTVASLPHKPVGFESAIAAVLADPTPGTADAVLTALEAFRDWPISREQTLSRFVRDNELAWFFRTVPPEYS